MAVDQNEVNALLEEMQDEIKLAKKLGINPKEFYKTDKEKAADKIYQQIQDEIALDKSLKKSQEGLQKIEEQVINKRLANLESSIKPDPELEAYKIQYMAWAKSTYTKNKKVMTPQQESSESLNAVQEFSKQKQEYQKLTEVTRIFDKMVNLANTDKGKENKTWDALRNMASDINLQTTANLDKAKVHPKIDHKTIAMKNLITALGGKPITMENMVNHFKELNTEQQNQSRLQTHSPSVNKSTSSQSTFSKTTISSPKTLQSPNITTSPTGRFNTKSNGMV